MLLIEKQKINDWIKELAKKTPVFAPIRRKKPEESVFEKFSPEMEIDFDYLPTLLSVKDFFLPPKENIFVFDKRRAKFQLPKKLNPLFFSA